MGYVGSMPMGMGLMAGTVPVMLSALAFAFLYMAVRYAYVDWRDAIVAGVVAAVAFEVAKRVRLLHHPIFRRGTVAYGTFRGPAAVPAVDVMSWLVTLLGGDHRRQPARRSGKATGAGRTFAGSEFFDALGILLLLYRACDEVKAQRGEFDMGRKLRMEADYLGRPARQAQDAAPGGQAPAGPRAGPPGAACDPSQVTLRTLYDRLVLNLGRLPRTAPGAPAAGLDLLRSMLDNPSGTSPSKPCSASSC